MSYPHKYGYSINDWEKAKAEAREALQERAKLRGMIPYSELADQIKTIRFEAYSPALWDLIGEISVEEDAEGRGMLSVIVVHKYGDMQPGHGFFELARQLGRDTTNVLESWISELKKVHAYWSID